MSEYYKILKQNKLKMSCSGCERIAMNVIFVIDENGRLKSYSFVNSVKCGQTFSIKLEQQFINWFQQQTFPIELYNLKFEVHLGKGLKC